MKLKVQIFCKNLGCYTVAKIISIRVMLAITAFHDYEIWWMDVKTVFLNGKLVEDVYMSQPEGFVDVK